MGRNPGIGVTFYTELERTPEWEQLAVNLYCNQAGEDDATVIPEKGTIDGVWLIMGANGILAFKEPSAGGAEGAGATG